MSRYVNGWVTPSGKFHECASFEHLKSVAACDELPADLRQWLDDELAGLASIAADSEAAIAKGEHPEWHCYEMAESSVQYKLRNKLLDADFVRVGTYGDELHFETNKVRKSRQRFIGLTIELGFKVMVIETLQPGIQPATHRQEIAGSVRF